QDGESIQEERLVAENRRLKKVNAEITSENLKLKRRFRSGGSRASFRRSCSGKSTRCNERYRKAVGRRGGNSNTWAFRRRATVAGCLRKSREGIAADLTGAS